jgi:hypothetical protein
MIDRLGLMSLIVIADLCGESFKFQDLVERFRTLFAVAGSP